MKLINTDELNTRQINELGMICKIKEETGVTDQKRLLIKYLNRTLPNLDIQAVPKKNYNVRKQMRYFKKQQLIKLWVNHIAMT